MGQWLPFIFGCTNKFDTKNSAKNDGFEPPKAQSIAEWPRFHHPGDWRSDQVRGSHRASGSSNVASWEIPPVKWRFRAGNFIQDFPAIPVWWPEGSNSTAVTQILSGKNTHPTSREFEDLHQSPWRCLGGVYSSKVEAIWTSGPIRSNLQPCVLYAQQMEIHTRYIALQKPETKNIQLSEFRGSCCTCEVGSNMFDICCSIPFLLDSIYSHVQQENHMPTPPLPGGSQRFHRLLRRSPEIRPQLNMSWNVMKLSWNCQQKNNFTREYGDGSSYLWNYQMGGRTIH